MKFCISSPCVAFRIASLNVIDVDAGVLETEEPTLLSSSKNDCTIHDNAFGVIDVVVVPAVVFVLVVDDESFEIEVVVDVNFDAAPRIFDLTAAASSSTSLLSMQTAKFAWNRVVDRNKTEDNNFMANVLGGAR